MSSLYGPRDICRPKVYSLCCKVYEDEGVPLTLQWMGERPKEKASQGKVQQAPPLMPAARQKSQNSVKPTSGGTGEEAGGTSPRDDQFAISPTYGVRLPSAILIGGSNLSHATPLKPNSSI